MNRNHPTSPENAAPPELDPAAAPTLDHAQQEQTIIPVVREELEVSTRRVETGAGVRIDKTVEAREEFVDEPLRKEEVEVERIAVGREVDGPVAVRYEGDTMIVPVLEEVLVVHKRLVLKEEIRITRRDREFRAPQRVVVRREHATVQRIEDPESCVPPAEVGTRQVEHDRPESLLDEKRRKNEEVLRKLRQVPAGMRKPAEPE